MTGNVCDNLLLLYKNLTKYAGYFKRSVMIVFSMHVFFAIQRYLYILMWQTAQMEPLALDVRPTAIAWNNVMSYPVCVPSVASPVGVVKIANKVCSGAGSEMWMKYNYSDVACTSRCLESWKATSKLCITGPFVCKESIGDR